MLDHIPQEVLEQLILDLELPDIQHLRLVNKTLGVRVLPALFRRISVTLETLGRMHGIARHPTISSYVEELWFQEWDFTGLADAPGVDQNPSIRYLRNTILQHIAHSRNLHISPTLSLWLGHTYPAPNAEFGEFAFEREGPEGDPDEDPELRRVQRELRQAIPKVISTYNHEETLQFMGYLRGNFEHHVFPHLPNLRRIVCVDPAKGVAPGYLDVVQDPSLTRLHDIFPVTDAGIRTTFRAYQTAWPGHGFLGVWGALGGSHHFPNIQHLEIRRDENLFLKRGIALGSIDSSLLGDVSDEAFRYLRSLNLCLEVDPRPRPRTWSRKLLAAIAGASHLRRLELSLTSKRSHAEMRLTDVLPMTPLQELGSVILEGFFFSVEDICQFLFMQTKLKNVALRRPVLYGSWVALVDLWSARAGFVLDSIELNHVLECDVLRSEHLDSFCCRVPPQLSTNAILHYINYGGDNPFASCCWKESERVFSDFVDAYSDFSDTSEWLPQDHPDPVEGPDGPEFDEDYDFDAEDDSDMDVDLAELQVDSVDNAGEGEDLDIEMIDLSNWQTYDDCYLGNHVQ